VDIFSGHGSRRRQIHRHAFSVNPRPAARSDQGAA
jgi:hypothetical protein